MMTGGAEQLAGRLAASLGGGVESEPEKLAAYAIDGKRPALLCRPATPEHAAGALRACAEAEAVVAVRGGGTAMTVGNVPAAVDVIVALERLDALIEHDHANLTATVQAGIRLSALQELLAPRDQFLPVDAPFPDRATAGGAVAANLNGPRRMLYGGIRDLVTGMKVVLITGEQIKSGGKVVKNVAGYDLCKLFTGSLGTLGAITEVTFRTFPVPETQATIVAQGRLDGILHLAGEVSRSPLLPAALQILNPAAAAMSLAPAAWTVALRSEGFEAAIKRHLRAAHEMAGKIGLDTTNLEGDAERRFWEDIRDLPLKPESIVHRISASLGSLARAMDAVQSLEAPGFQPRVVGDAGTGTLWISLDAEAVHADRFSKLAALAQNFGGHAVLWAAPSALKEGIDVWGAPPPGFSIMRRIKRQFDPKNLLNPGRFVAGL